jgi:hypothetical protein
MSPHWQPRIGDPSPMGWVTVFSYYLSALICFLPLFRKQVRHRQHEIVFWCTASFGMLLLGLVKEFNLLVAVKAIARLAAQSYGVVDMRRPAQALVMGLLVLTFVACLIPCIRAFSSVGIHHRLTICGGAYLLLFVLFRGISLHAFDELLDCTVLGARLNWIIELSGIYWVMFSVIRPGFSPGSMRSE